MDALNLNVDPIVLAAYAMKAFNQTHGLAYAHISQDFTIRQTSPNFSQFIHSPHTPVGMLLSEVVAPFVGLEETLQEILDGLMPIYLLEYVAYDQPDGEVGYFNFQLSPIDNQNPKYGLLLLIEDVSRTGRLQQAIVQERNELSLMQEHLKMANDKLQQLNQQKSLFMSIIAHDLRGPLSGIQGFASLIKIYIKKMHIDDTHLIGYADNIISQVALLNSMISDLHALDRIEENNVALKFGTDSINTIIDEIEKATALDLKRKYHTLHIHMPDEPLTIRADIPKLWRIIYNLLNNAIKYTPDGGEIHLTAYQESEESVVVKVADNGTGMTADEITYLFNPYYRAGNVKKSGASGSGLGLYIVKGLVEAHDGRIEVVSQPDEGSTFTVHLPIIA